MKEMRTQTSDSAEISNKVSPKVVQIVISEGLALEFQFTDLIHAEICEGVHVLSGRVYDIFA